MKKFLFLFSFVLTLSLNVWAQTYTPLPAASWPDGALIDVPVYVNYSVNDLVRPLGAAPPPPGYNISGIVNQAMALFRANGSRYRYYYAGVTSATACTSSYSVIVTGFGYGGCPNGNFTASIGSSVQIDGNLPGTDIGWSIFVSAFKGVTGAIDVGRPPAETLNSVQGGLAFWPTVRKPYSYSSSVWQAPQLHPNFPNRSTGYSPFACADNATKNSYDCVDVDTVGNLRFLRTDRVNPAAITQSCQSTDAPNCWATLKRQTQSQIWVPFQYTFTAPTDVWFDARMGVGLAPTPAIARDHVRNKIWVFWGNQAFTSDDQGRNWTYRGQIVNVAPTPDFFFARAATYDPVSDRIVVVGIIEVAPSSVGTATPTIAVATIPAGATPVTVACGNLLYGATGCTTNGLPNAWGPSQNSAWTLTTQLLAPDRVSNFTGVASISTGLVGSVSCGSARSISGFGSVNYCSYIYNDGSVYRATRELVFRPHDPSSGKAWVLSSNPVHSSVDGWPNGLANNNWRSGADGNGTYVLNSDNDLYDNGRSGNGAYWGWGMLPPAPGVPLAPPKAIFGLSLVERIGGSVYDLIYRGGVLDAGCYINGVWWPQGPICAG